MAESTIDTLSLEIDSNAEQAIGSIDKLANSLYNLKNKMSGFQKKGFGNLPEEFQKLNSALSDIDSGKILSFSNALSGLSESIRTFSDSGKQINPAARNLEKISKLKINGDFSGFGSLASGINDFASAAPNLAKVSPKEINRTVSAFEKLGKINLSEMANSFRSFNGIDASVLGDLGAAFQSFASSLSGFEKVPGAIGKLFNSLSQLAVSAGNIPMVTTALPGLTSEITNFVGVMSVVPAVQSGTVSIVSALAQISSSGEKAQKVSSALPAVTSGVKVFIEELSKVPLLDSGIVRTVESLSRLADAGGRAGMAANKLQNQVNSLSVSMGKLRGGATGAVGGLKSFTKQIFSMLGIVGGVYGVFEGIKKSISIASDLSEAQNVVKEGFGSMIGKIEEFSKTSIESFGISGLAAKNTAGIYAVMAKSLGVMPDVATDMAVSLTGLTGDLSSFYNVSQDVANTTLKSIFTGETESLKKFGIVMTEANLKAYALSQGITKSYSAMSQAEKVQLRYNFVMDAASSAMGDFARTSAGSWANQVRILSQSFQQLAGIVGSGLMAALLPIIKVINQVMAKIIQLATVISSLLGKLLGFKKATAGSGAGLAGVADAAGVVGDNMDAAAGGISNAGGAAKKAGKEMNKFVAAWHEVNSMSSENDTDGGGGGGAGGGGIADMSLPSNYTFQIEAEDKVSPILEKIKKRFMDLSKLFLKGFKFGLGDTSVFNSIQENLKSIRDSFIDIFTDKDVVSKFNEMLDTLVYNSGVKIGSFVSIGASIIDNILGGVSIYLDEAKERIKQWLIEMFDITAKTDTIKTNFIKALSDIFSVFRSDEAKELTASIIQIFVDAFMNISELAAKLGRDILDLILNPITENAEFIKEALFNTITPLGEVMGTLADSFTVLWEKVQSVYDEHVKPMFDSFKEGISEIVRSLLDGYNTHISPVLDRLAEKFTQVWNGTIHPLLENFLGLFGNVADFITAVLENVLQPVINWVASEIMPAVAPVLEEMGNIFLNTFDDIGKIFDGFITAARGILEFLTGVFSGEWGRAWEGIKEIFKGIWDAMPELVKVPIRAIIGFVNRMIESVESGINYVVRAVNGLDFSIPDWVPGVGGKSFGFNVNEISLGRIPQLAKGGIADHATLALIGENGKEAVLPLERNTQWMDDLSRQIAKNVSKFENLRLDYTVPQIDDYKIQRSNFDVSRMQSTLQMCLDEKAALETFEIRQLKDSVEQNTRILEKLLEQGVILNDNEFTRRYQRSAVAYGRRTGKELGLYI